MKDFSSLIVTQKTNIREAIQIIESGIAQIALVVDKGKKLVGTVTDGDIRRGLLRGETLESEVENVMQREFRALPADCPESQAFRLMRDEVLHQVPGIDSEGYVVRLFLFEDLIKTSVLPNWVVLMAGGKGKRLRPLTNNCPKPMLRVAGKPVLEIILEQCVESGFKKFFISVNYLKQQIIDYFGDGARWNVEINYLKEDKPLGTVGALGLLYKRPDQPILVINGDVLTRVNFSKLIQFHERQQSFATICVREHETMVPYGVVQLEGSKIVSFDEKPQQTNFVNAGVYALNPEVMDLMSPGQNYDMPQLINLILQKKYHLTAFPIHEYWLDVGHSDTYELANGEWA